MTLKRNTTSSLFGHLTLIALFFGAIISTGCGSESQKAPKYIATVTTDQHETTLDLYAAQEGNSEDRYLESFSLGYGAMNYLNNQGTVPDWQVNVPDSCRNSTSLGIEHTAPCVFAPLLQSVILKYGADKKDFAVTAVFSKNENPEFMDSDIVPLTETLDSTLERYGYDAQIYYDPQSSGDDPEMLTSIQHYHGAYSHRDRADNYYSDWMTYLINSWRLNRLSIPGTHDTMSLYGGDMVATQSMELSEQLRAGIRALDIRCRHINNAFAIHHGMVYQKKNFDDVLTTVRHFLQNNPQEFIVMRVKEEYDPTGNTRSFGATFKTYFDAYGSLFWQPALITDTNPTVREMRGKIVVLQDWDDTQIFGIQWNRNGSYRLEIQDNWDVSTRPEPFHAKWRQVRDHLGRASSNTDERIFVNFFSASSYIQGVFGFPYFFASGKSSPGTNDPLRLTGWTTPGWKNHVPDFPRVSCVGKICSIAYLGINILASNKLESRTPRIGIIYADFPGSHLIRRVISQNTFGPPD